MEKYQIIVKIGQIKKYLEQGECIKAATLAAEIDPKKLKSMSDLSVIAEAYFQSMQYKKARSLFLQIYEKTKSRRILAQLVHLSIKLEDAVEAEKYLSQYIEIAPNDFYQYIFRYSIDRLLNKPDEELIRDLEAIKKAEYMENWAYELAKLYHKTGDEKRCVAECSDIILWFGSGIYVEKAKALRAYYTGETDSEKTENVRKTANLQTVEEAEEKKAEEAVSEEIQNKCDETEETENLYPETEEKIHEKEEESVPVAKVDEQEQEKESVNEFIKESVKECVKAEENESEEEKHQELKEKRFEDPKENTDKNKDSKYEDSESEDSEDNELEEEEFEEDDSEDEGFEDEDSEDNDFEAEDEDSDENDDFEEEEESEESESQSEESEESEWKSYGWKESEQESEKTYDEYNSSAISEEESHALAELFDASDEKKKEKKKKKSIFSKLKDVIRSALEEEENRNYEMQESESKMLETKEEIESSKQPNESIEAFANAQNDKEETKYDSNTNKEETIKFDELQQQIQSELQAEVLEELEEEKEYKETLESEITEEKVEKTIEQKIETEEAEITEEEVESEVEEPQAEVESEVEEAQPEAESEVEEPQAEVESELQAEIQSEPEESFTYKSDEHECLILDEVLEEHLIINPDNKMYEILREKQIKVADLTGDFTRVDSVARSIIQCLETVCDRPSRNVNLMIAGENQMGKKTLGKLLARDLYALGINHSSKVALIHASRLNRMNLQDKMAQLTDCMLIIEEASELSEESILRLQDIMSDERCQFGIILDGQTVKMDRLFAEHDTLRTLFYNRMFISNLDANDYLGYAFCYLNGRDYQVREDAFMALCENIDRIVKEENNLEAVTKYLKQVIHNAEERNAKKIAALTESKEYETAELLVLRIEDFTA